MRQDALSTQSGLIHGDFELQGKAGINGRVGIESHGTLWANTEVGGGCVGAVGSPGRYVIDGEINIVVGFIRWIKSNRYGTCTRRKFNRAIGGAIKGGADEGGVGGDSIVGRFIMSVWFPSIVGI